jgi:phosphatidylglycerol---prolipoprotein diacylglyceryl transferase
MFPTLFKIGGFAVHTYGALIALGVFLAAKYVLQSSKKTKLSEGQLLDLILYTVIAGIIGARLTYVAANLSYYLAQPVEIFKIWEGGLVFYGGFAAGAVTFLIYANVKAKGRVWKIMDVFAPALALSHFFGRLGCFFAGCCYGTSSVFPWAVRFTEQDCLAPLNVSLHPTQLYEAFGNFVIFLILDRYNKLNHARGQAFILYLMLYGGLRFVTEFFRGDARQGFYFGLSFAQAASICLILLAVILSFVRPKNEI